MSDHNPSADPFGQIADEFVEAIRQGKRPSLEEFARRYPAHADEIRDMLPALLLMEQAKTTDESPGQARSTQASAAALPLQQLGDYQLLREVGRGGMGVVYEAQQLSLNRHVAIKVLPAHALLDTRQLGRFQREARSAAKLHHTNIVPVYGVGEQDGMHYYVMQFIHGLGLDVVLDELRRLRHQHGKRAATLGEASGRPTNLPHDASAVAGAHGLLTGEFRPPEAEPALMIAPGDLGASSSVRAGDTSATIHLPGQSGGSTLSDSGNQYWQSVARVGMQVADALAHAASQGVLHRDIKPSNLLLDETGNVWVTDFGLAKAVSDSDNLTHTGDIVGTLRYMAPERFDGLGDLRSDTYSLGLTLYEMLVLRPAFNEADRNKLVKEVMHAEPVRPRKLNRSVPRDLETVVLKAIARDPAHRYQTPAEMSEDLKRFVEDRPVRARRINTAEQFWRWCRRNPLPASLLAGIVLMFLIGFAGVSWQWREAEMARQEEQLHRDQAVSARKGAETARDEAKQSRNAAARQAAGLLLDRGIEDARGGEPARALHLFVQALRALPPDDPQAAALERVIRANLFAWAETVPALEHIWPGGTWGTDVAFTPDGQRIAVAIGKDEVQCFRTDTGRPVGPPSKITLWHDAAMEFAADGRSLWIASPGPKNYADPWAVYRMNPESGRPVQAPIPSTGPVNRLAVTPDGRYLVGTVWGLHPEDRGPQADADRTRKWRTASLVVWETATGRVVRKVDVNAESVLATANEWPDSYMSLSPDGRSVTAWVQRGADRFEGMSFTVDGNEPPRRVALPAVGTTARWTLHFEKNMRIALAIKGDQLHRWSAANPGVLGPGIPVPFRSLLYGPSADGRSVVSPTDGRLYDSGPWPPRPSGVRFTHPGWHRTKTSWMEHSPDGRFTATWLWNHENRGRLWRLPRPHSRPTLPSAELARSPDRADNSHDALFDLRGSCAVLWSDRREYTQLDDDVHQVRVVDVTTGTVRTTSLRHSKLVRQAAISPDGRYFATGSFDSTARVWETATGRPAGPPQAHMNYVATVAFSPDGSTLAAGDFGPDGLIKLWDWRTGREVRPPLRHNDIVLSVGFSPDGRYLTAIKSDDWSKVSEILVWEVESGRSVVRAPYACTDGLLPESTPFRPDNRAVMARDINGVLRLWEVPSGKILGERPLEGNGKARFSPDGRVVAASANLGVRLLDGDTLASLPAGYLPHPDPIRDVAFSPDGALLLTAHETGSAQLWDLATRKPVGPPAVLIEPIRAVAFTPDGKTCLCVAADGAIRRWPVPAPFAEPDLARLADRVALMTGQRMENNQGLDSIPAEEWRSLRAKLVGEGSTALIPPRSDADWHDTIAADAEQDGDPYGAEWHLNRLAILRPKDWIIPARRGRVLEAAGRNNEAAAAYDKAARLVRSPRDLAEWLRAAAADHETAKRYDQALWNLDRAIKLTPDDWTLYAARALLARRSGRMDRTHSDLDELIRRGADDTATIARLAEAAAGSGDWKRTAALFATLARIPNLPIQVRYLQALASLKADNRAGYRAVCAAIAAQVPPIGPRLSGGAAFSAAMVFALGPNATDDWTTPLAWSDHALARLRAYEKANPDQKDRLRREKHLFLGGRAILLYRAGRCKEAVEVLGQAMPFHPQGGDYSSWVFLALAEHRLGHSEAARKAADKARKMRAGSEPDNVWDRAELELLAAELDAAAPLPNPGSYEPEALATDVRRLRFRLVNGVPYRHYEHELPRTKRTKKTPRTAEP